MKEHLHVYYDEEGDFLELHVGKFREGSFINLGEGIFQRVDKKTEKITGIAIMGFRQRTKQLKEVDIALPVKIELSSLL